MKYLHITGTLKMTPPGTVEPPRKMVFQRVRPGLGNLPEFPGLALQLREHVIPADPRTPAQVARRNLMAAAVARWRARTPADVTAWTIISRARNIPLFNACCSDTLRNYHLDGGTLVKNNP